jgi:alkylhydroperoxidase family enzyme
MSRLPFLLTLAAVSACGASSTYTIEAADLRNANERAARYCQQQDATARLEGVAQQADRAIQIYRCVASR